MRGLFSSLARRFRGREWLPAALWAGAILAVSSIPGGTIGGGLFPGCDKLAHLIEYSVLGSLLGFWVVTRGGAGRGGGATGALPGRAQDGRPRWHPAAWLVAAAVAFAGLDEVHQRLIPGREMDFWDFGADTAGVVLGLVVALARLPGILPAGSRGEERRDG
jgi:hypothetical protein